MNANRPLITCAGINHVTAPIEEREKLAFTRDELTKILPEIAAALDGVVILSTCNRTEIYTTAAEGETAPLIDLLNEIKAVDIDASHFYAHQSEAAVEHLYRVASGIDSMVLGESQILGQVREAMSIASGAETLNPALSHLFHTAVRVGKRARSETDIGGHAVSVGSAAVSLARRALGDLAGKTVLVISAGSMGKLAACSLAQQTHSHILVANRTRARAEDLASQLGPETEALDFEHLQTALASADIVISGTGSAGYVLGLAEVAAAMDGRENRGIFFIDIAVPRDIDPVVREIAGVDLCDIDDIEAITDEGWSGRHSEVEKVEAIIVEQVAAFAEWLGSQDIVPVISALRERAEAIRLKEIERTLGKMNLDEGDRERIEAMTAAIVKKMLDRPIARLKSGSDRAVYMEALADLFDSREPDGD